MASSSSSTAFSVSFHDQDRQNTEPIWAVVATINQQMHEFVFDTKTWNSVKLRCTSKLNTQTKEHCEFAEHSVLSNLYWGIESVEAAIHSKQKDEKSRRLENAEQMLQAPALLDEAGDTAEIQNQYLICCSYFYLSVVKKLQGDEWKVASHFLQAVLVSPGLVWTEFAPKLCKNLFLLYQAFEKEEAVSGRGGLKSESSKDFDDKEISKEMGRMARKYKAWLTYYQVMAYGGETKRQFGCRDVASANTKMHSSGNRKSISSNSQEDGNSLLTSIYSEKVHPLGTNGCKMEGGKSKALDMEALQEHTEILTPLNKVHSEERTRNSNIKCLQDLLIESQSDTPISEDSCNISSDEGGVKVNADESKSTKRSVIMADDPQPEISSRNEVEPCSTSGAEYLISWPHAQRNRKHDKSKKESLIRSYSGRFYLSFSDSEPSIFKLGETDPFKLSNCHIQEGKTRRRSEQYDLPIFNHIRSTSLKEYQLTDCQGTKRSKRNLIPRKKPNEVGLHAGKGFEIAPIEIIQKAISKLCFSEGLGSCDEDYTIEVVRMYEMLSNKKGVKYTLLKDIILDQLLTAISSSKELGVVRVSVSILSIIVSENKAVIRDLNNNGLELCNLASALKRNVHEAAILIYLINPSPIEIKTLELLPTLTEIVCTSKSCKSGLALLQITPPAASLMIIEVLVTAFDNGTNNKHLAAINSPRVFSGLLSAPRENNLEDLTSLAAILVRCMQFDGLCRQYISKSTSMAPFVSLLGSNRERTKLIALEFFHEILLMPRSSAVNLMQQIRNAGGVNNMNVLLLLIQQLNQDHKLLAANLLLQLDILEDSPGKSRYKEQAVEVLLKSLTIEENSAMQELSASLMSNLGGTYAWTGEPYTVAWLLKKTGLTLRHHRNMIRNFGWTDESLQDSGTDKWCSKIGRSIVKIEKPLLLALEKGLQSKINKISRDCLTAITWISCEIARAPDNLRYTAWDTLLSAVEQFLHPGFELEERLLACLCIYNYASGKGMHKITHFSEGVRESLRRLTNVTWMAQELLRVADYFLPNKWRISCVHTQILEASQKHNGAVTALIYYKGQLFSGYADGSIKVWDIKGQTTRLALDMKEHKKAVTCFALFEPGDCLLSGSADKTIRIWQVVQRKLECIEVIVMKESIRSLDAHEQLLFVVTQNHRMKVLNPSRTAKDVCKAKNVKCVKVANGKAYVGCMDSSIQELSMSSNHEREIKAPSKIWMLQGKPINSIAIYKDWLYSASAAVEGSNIKEWRRRSKPQISIVPERGGNVLAVEVAEDFIYLNSSSSTSTLQIWLRGTQQKVGRLSAGSKITSLLAGNDIILCGTESGLIKGWIPL